MPKKIVVSLIILSLVIAVAAAYAVAAAKGATSYVQKLKEGDRFACALDHMEMKVMTATPYSEYQGKYYYFCNDAEKKLFDANPAKYINPPAAK